MSYLEDPRVFFAAERTLLAWLRTGIALMGFGTLLGKLTVEGDLGKIYGMALGATMCALGAVGNLYAARQFAHFVRTLSTVEIPAHNSSLAATVSSIASGIIGIALVVYILLPR